MKEGVCGSRIGMQFKAGGERGSYQTSDGPIVKPD